MKVAVKTAQILVTTAGTPVPAASDVLWVTNLTLKALPGNTKNIFLSNADGTPSSDGFPIKADEAYPLTPGSAIDLSTLLLDAEQSGEGVAIAYEISIP